MSYKHGDITESQARMERNNMSPALVRDIKARIGMDKMLEMGNKSKKKEIAKKMKSKIDKQDTNEKGGFNYKRSAKEVFKKYLK